MSCHAVAGRVAGTTPPRARCWDDTTEGEADTSMRSGGPCLQDLQLVGSTPQNDLTFPGWEVGAVGAPP